MSGNGGDPISTEAITAEKRNGFEIREIEGQKLQTLVGDGHPLKPELLQQRVLVGERRQPGVDVGAPVGRDQVEVREPRLALQRDAPDVGEPPRQDLRRHRVAVPDEHVPPRPPLRVVPLLAHQRRRAPVLARLYEPHHSLQHLVRKTRRRRRRRPRRLARVAPFRCRFLLSLRLH